MERWYSLYTKPQSERIVAKLLEQRAITTFYPEIRVTIANKQKRRTPLFPGYLFARLDFDSGDPSVWRWTPGLRYVVAYGDWPIPVPDDVVRLMYKKVSSADTVAQILGQDLQVGDLVRIKNGPFKDMLAVFEGPTPPGDRVHLLLSALNRSVKVRVDLDNLKKVSSRKNWSEKKRPRRTRGRGRRIG